MYKFKIQQPEGLGQAHSKFKITRPTFVGIPTLKFLILSCSFTFYVLTFMLTCFAQEGDLKFTLDANSNTVVLPKIFRPSIDLSGRGFHRQLSWPQAIAAQEVLDVWEKEIGFNGMYRLQYNFWEINERAKDKDAQDNLLSNYENIIKKISEAGGVVILDIFGTPAGLGKVLDKRSIPLDLKTFKELVKSRIKYLSCDKRYNIWYEVWSAPDLDDFFLGRIQEYLNLYRVIAEVIKELENETKIHILLGGPSVSWWFQNLDGNTIVTPERSLIYALIKFCSRYKLPLDFITWHAYSNDPKTEKETNIYNKTAISLIRDWLTYFHFEREIPLILTEWNYDSAANVLPARGERSFVGASFIPARLKNMYKAGLTYQLYFSLEDFQNNPAGVVRNTGIFWFDAEASNYKGGPKSIYNVFRMLANLGNNMFLTTVQPNDEFVDALSTKQEDNIAILIYNYIDPDIAINYLSRNIASLNAAERKTILNLIKTDRLGKIVRRQSDILRLRASNKVKSLLKKMQELDGQATKFKDTPRNIKIAIKNLQRQDYLYQRYTVDSECSINCEFVPLEEKEISILDTQEAYQELLTLKPYSVNLIVLKKKPLGGSESPPLPSPTHEQSTQDNR